MYKLEHLDNQQSAGQSAVGKEAKFHYDGHRFLFGSIISSTVKEITKDEDIMVVTTRNSVYTFKEVH